MFRFQDLLHTKIVYPTWMSSFHEWTESLIKDILSDEHLLNTNTNPDLAIAIDKTTGDKVDLTIAQAYAFQVKDVLDLMICSTTIEAVAEQFMVGDINENKGMMDFMQGILSKTNEAFGGVCELDIAYHHEAPYACQFTVVDRKGEKSKAPATIDIFGLL